MNETASARLAPFQVAATIVAFNSRTTIEPCIESLLQQNGFEVGANLRVIVVDNHSVDGTASFVEARFGGAVELTAHQENLGFAGGQNEAITAAVNGGAEYVLLINPDLRLAPDALRRLCDTLSQDTRAGWCCPKLLRADEALNPIHPPVIDSTGMFITPALRHFDRGAGEPDRGQYERDEYVFGASGACALLRRSFILDAALSNNPGAPLELFDNRFFAYREDADLSWRACRLGWRCRYLPAALGYHQRVVTPERRAILPAEINAFGVRNRFLLQWNNFSFAAQWWCLPAALWRNLIVVIAVLTVERSSLAALKEAFARLPESFALRRRLAPRVRTSAATMSRYFQRKPFSEPALCLQPSSAKIRSICAVIINYNSGDRLRRCLELLQAAKEQLPEDLELTIAVVDNGSADGSAPAAAAALGTAVEFHTPPGNLGFGGGINFAARRHPTDALLVLNPDIELSANAIEALAGALNHHAELALASPVLTDADGAVQYRYTLRALPGIGSTLAELFLLHRLWPKNPWTKSYYLEDRFSRAYLDRRETAEGEPHDNPRLPLVVPQPAGACMMIRRGAFDQLEGFDESFWPAWYEDVDFCKRLPTIGCYAAVVGRVSAIHEGGYSLEALPARQFLAIWYRNMLRYWRKHGSTVEYWLVRALLPVALLLRSAASFCAGVALLGKERKAARSRLEDSKSLARLAFCLHSVDS